MINNTELLIKAQELRKKLEVDQDSPIDIFALVHSIENLTLVFYPMGNNISGMCIKDDFGDAIIAISSQKTFGRPCFSLAQELYHLYYDDEMTTVCSSPLGAGSTIEKTADQFASYFLIPPLALRTKILDLKKNRSISNIGINEVVFLEQYFSVSRQAILNRLVNEKELKPSLAESMKTNVILYAKSLGYSSELYLPLPREKQYGTYGQIGRAHV